MGVNILSSGDQTQAVIGHVGIEVSSLKASRRFYTCLFGGLGFKIIMDSEDGLAFSNGAFSIWTGELQKPRVKRKAPTGEEFVVIDHLAILVSDRRSVRNIEKEMKKNGFEALFPCEEHPKFEPGYFAVSFCDPDNFVIEVYSKSGLNRL